MDKLKILDLFGMNPEINVEGNNKRKLPEGGMISLSLIFIYIFLFINFGQDCFQKRNPKGYSQIKPNDQKSKSINFSDKNFFIGYRVASIFSLDGDLFKEVMYLSFEFQSVSTYNKTTKWEAIPLNTTTCDKIDFDREKLEHSTYNLSQYMCPDISPIKNRSIEGDWQTANRSYITCKLSFCENDKLENCKNPKNVSKFFDNARIIVNTLYPEVEYNIDDSEKPFKTFLGLHYNYISPNKYTFQEYYLTKYILNEDIGLFFEDKKIKETLGIERAMKVNDVKSFDETYTNMGKPTYDNAIIYQMFYFYDKRNVSHFRSYLKIPDILAKCASLLQILLSVISIIFNIYAKKSFEAFLCNRLILVEDEFKVNGKNEYNNFDSKEFFTSNFFKQKSKKFEENNEGEIINHNNNVNNENTFNDKINKDKSTNNQKIISDIADNNNDNNNNNNNYEEFSNEKSIIDDVKLENLNQKQIEAFEKFRIARKKLQQKVKSNDLLLKNKNEKIEKNDNSKNNQTNINDFEVNNNNNKFNNENSCRNLIELENLKEKDKEKVKNILELYVTKHREEKNLLKKNFYGKLVSLFCSKKYPIITKQQKFIYFMGRKFIEKLDIFYYLKRDRINKIIEKLTIPDNKKNLIELISLKNFIINLTKFDFDNKSHIIEEENKNFVDYFLSKQGIDIDQSDKILIEELIAY